VYARALRHTQVMSLINDFRRKHLAELQALTAISGTSLGLGFVRCVRADCIPMYAGCVRVSPCHDHACFCACVHNRLRNTAAAGCGHPLR